MAGNYYLIKEGSYRLRYRGQSRNVEAKSDRQAEQQLAKFITEVDSADYAKSSKLTFRQFAEKWLKDYAEVDLAPKTVYRYRQLLESRIYPAIGEKKLEKVRPLDLVDFYNSLRKRHKYISIKNLGGKDEARETKEATALSESTIKHHHRVISAIFEKAIMWSVLKGNNPVKRVNPPKTEKKKARCYGENQVQDLLAALETVKPEEMKYKAATMIALMTGARLGEIMALEWRDIDTVNEVIEIRQSSQYLPGQGTFTKSPKTETSKRRVSVNNMLLAILAQYQDQQREKDFNVEGSGRLFVTWDGKPMFPETVSKWFRGFLQERELPAMNFHGLRHTSATFLISRGMDIQTVAGRLGHSTSATTQNIYSHFLESKDRQAADLMEAAFTKKEQAPAEKEGKKEGKVISMKAPRG